MENKNYKGQMMTKKYYIIAFLLLLLPSQLVAATALPPIVIAYTIHASQLIKALILLTILFRKSIEKQHRLNWFFGAVAVLYLSASMQVFQRFFASPNSVIYEAYIVLMLSIYFVFYLIKTWPRQNIDNA